jgi:carboxyl-terminal processing protease
MKFLSIPRLIIPFVSVILLIKLFYSFDFENRGFHFEPESRSFAKEISGIDHDLSKLRLMTISIGYLRRFYIEPALVQPKEMLVSALKNVQSFAAEVLLSVRKDKNDVPEGINLRINQSEKFFNISNVTDLYEMNWKFVEIFDFIDKNLGEDLEKKEVEYTAINGLLKTLDEHSVFLDPLSYREMKLDTQGKFGGLGIVIQAHKQYIIIKSVLKNTPAEKAGLKKNDLITQIDDESTVNMDINEAVSHLRGYPGTKVTLLIQRKNDPVQGSSSNLKKFTLTRDEIKVLSVTSMLVDGKIGYIKLGHFQGDSDKDIMAHIKKLEKNAHSKLKGLILDMRNNPGGLLDQAIKVSDLFLTEGVIVVTEGNGNKLRDESLAKWDGTKYSFPLIVLVNRGSASASEIVAGALKNNGRALIIGEKTFGKGTVQSLYEIEDSALKLTIAQYLTPGDFSIQGVGVEPNVFITPVSIQKNRVNVFHGIESDYQNPFLKYKKKLKAIGKIKPEKPEVIAKYFREIKENANQEKKAVKDEDEDNGDDSDNGDNDGEDDLKFKENEEANPEIAREFILRLSSALLLEAGDVSARTTLEKGKNTIGKFLEEEDRKIVTKLNESGINWETAQTNEKPSRLKGTVKLMANPVKILAGDELKLRMIIKNEGQNPVSRIHAVSDSENIVFRDMRFVFGKIMPGEEKLFDAVVKIPKRHPTRMDEVKFKIFSDNDFLQELETVFIRVNELPKPKFAYTYDIKDPAGNSVVTVPKTDNVKIVFGIKNAGKGRALELVVRLKNKNGKDVFLIDGYYEHKKEPDKNGVAEFRILEPGEELKTTFSMNVKSDTSRNPLEFELEILDRKIGEYMNEKLKIPVADGDKKNPEQKSAETKFMRIPPMIEIENETSIGLSTHDNTLHISGNAIFTGSSSSSRKSVYIFNNDDKIFFKTLSDTKANSQDQFVMDFSDDIPLTEGVNQIFIYAQEGRDHLNQKVITILRMK